MIKRIYYIILVLFAGLFIPGLQSAAQQTKMEKIPLYSISRMSFNKDAFSDMCPVMYNDGILFCSTRRFSAFKDRTSFDGKRIYNIYQVQKIDTSEWTTPAIVKSEYSTLFTNGALSIASDKKTVYFTSDVDKSNVSKSRKAKNTSGVFIAEMTASGLQNIVPFKYNSIAYNLANPSVSSDGKYLFFSSDMPGGQGMGDIWYCENINGEWAAPVNPGPKVNSSRSDNFPYMHPSGKLYFASDRPGGMGGYDVYYTSINYGNWESPERMAEPINSSSDDFGFFATDDLQAGYFSSARTRNDDIYKWTSNIIRKAVCDTLAENYLCFEYAELNAAKFDSIPFRFIWRFSDGSKEEGISVVHCFSGPGTYITHLDIENLLTKEVLYNEKIDTLVLELIEQPYISSPDEVKAGQQFKLNADSTNLPGWNITRYYWNYEDGSFDVGNEVSKVYTKPGKYNVQLIVTGEAEPGGMAKEACICKNIVVTRQP
jgi:hypothetical protein